MSYPAEHEIYDELHNNNVHDFLRCIAHMDVPGSLHKTLALNGQVLGHYILVLDKVEMELQCFPSTHVFVTAILHTGIGMYLLIYVTTSYSYSQSSL